MMIKAIFEDTRQQAGKHENIAEYCKNNKIELIRQALFVGDYVKITDQSVSVDTKKDLPELVMDVGTDRSRFMREVSRARKHGIKLIVLCEHGKGITKLADVQFWENPMLNPKNKRYNPRAMSGKMLMKRMIDIHIEYGTEFLFCEKSETGAEIIRLLYE
jgi:hypothetical protein